MLLGTIGVDPFNPVPTDGGGIVVEIDWERNGWGVGSEDAELPYAEVYVDPYGTAGTAIYSYVTRYVRRAAQPVTVEYGRDQTSALSPTVAGRGGFTLGNEDRRFSPRNTSGPLYGLLKPARPVRITRQIGSAVYGLFTGHTDDQPLHPDPDDRTVALTLLDYLADLRGQTITTALHRDIHTGDAINAVLDACGWSTELRDIDRGATIIPWWWEDNADALDAIEKIVQSEGPPALITQGGSGEIIFRDRHHRLTAFTSLVSQSTWRDLGTVEPVMLRGAFSYDEAWSQIVNTGTVSVDVRQPTAVDVVWSAGEESTVTLATGEQRVITATASEPFLGALTPEAGIDYVLKSGTVSARLMGTSGLSVGIELTASAGGPVVLTALQLRAQPLAVAYTVTVSASNAASVEEYGPRAYPNDLPWCGVYDAQSILDHTVAMRSLPLAQVTAGFMVGNITARATSLLGRDLSDRVTVIEPETGISGDFYVESIRHELTGEHDHTVTFGLEAAFADIEPVARCDVIGHGADQGILSLGVDDAALIARCDIGTSLLNNAVAAH